MIRFFILGDRLTVGHGPLKASIGVRIPVPQLSSDTLPRWVRCLFNSKSMYTNRLKEDALALLDKLFRELEVASKGKLSTNEITPDRLLWEIINKIFSILVTCENCLRSKDSLAIHLIARYTYEMLIVFAYIFLNRPDTGEMAKQFTRFNQFKSDKRKWTDETIAHMAENIPNKERFANHKEHYRNLSNFAHPTMDSFLLNRRGDISEFSMILNTLLLTVRYILGIIAICFEVNLYFDDQQKKKINLASISSEAERIMKELSVLSTSLKLHQIK